MIWACLIEQKDVVQLLLDHSDRNIDINVRDNYGRTALMWASLNEDKDIVRLIMECSEDIDISGLEESTEEMRSFIEMYSSKRRKIS